MTGRHAPGRVRGWVGLAQVPLAEMDLHVRVAWAEWAEELTAEAQAAGFTPAGIGSKRPRGPAVAAWSKQFLARHTYCTMATTPVEEKPYRSERLSEAAPVTLHDVMRELATIRHLLEAQAGPAATEPRDDRVSARLLPAVGGRVGQ